MMAVDLDLKNAIPHIGNPKPLSSVHLVVIRRLCINWIGEFAPEIGKVRKRKKRQRITESIASADQ